MRLFEIFSSQPDDLPDGPESKRLKKLQGVGKPIGTPGGYAQVRQGVSDKRKDQVRKVPNSAMWNNFSDDPFMMYARAVKNAQDKGNRNPYFPKVIKIKPIKDKNNLNLYLIDLEKLYPGSSLSKEEIEAVKEKMFHNYKKLGQLKNPSIDVLITDAYENNPGNIKDPEFAAALRLVRHVHQVGHETMLGFDIAGKHDNYLFRKVGGVPELVLSDPLG